MDYIRIVANFFLGLQAKQSKTEKISGNESDKVMKKFFFSLTLPDVKETIKLRVCNGENQRKL